jgi:hypothetical protein
VPITLSQTSHVVGSSAPHHSQRLGSGGVSRMGWEREGEGEGEVVMLKASVAIGVSVLS